MSEQTMTRPARREGLMAELDQWSESEVINPLFYAGAKSVEEGAEADWETVVEEAKKKIRAKMLESYRNGQAAGPRKPSPQPAFVSRGYYRRP